MPRGRPPKPKGEHAAQITVTARARTLIDEHLRQEWADLFDRGIFTTMTVPHFIASQRRARVSELIEEKFGPEGQYPTTVSISVPLPERMSDAEAEEVRQWSERLVAQMNETMPAAVRAAIAANEVRLIERESRAGPADE